MKLYGVAFSSWEAAGMMNAAMNEFKHMFVGQRHMLLPTTGREAWVVYTRPLTARERRTLGRES